MKPLNASIVDQGDLIKYQSMLFIVLKMPIAIQPILPGFKLLNVATLNVEYTPGYDECEIIERYK